MKRAVATWFLSCVGFLGLAACDKGQPGAVPVRTGSAQLANTDVVGKYLRIETASYITAVGRSGESRTFHFGDVGTLFLRENGTYSSVSATYVSPPEGGRDLQRKDHESQGNWKLDTDVLQMQSSAPTSSQPVLMRAMRGADTIWLVLGNVDTNVWEVWVRVGSP